MGPLRPAFAVEGFGIAAAEAMAMEKAVVASAVEGLIEIAQNGISGILIPPSQPGPLAEAVIQLLGDPGRRASIGAAARRRIAESFSIDTAAAGLRALYDSLFERRTRRSTTPGP